MASGGSPYDEYKARNSDYKPKSNRKPPRYGTSFETELSLNSELQRSESEERRSLPNNLSWTGGEGSRGKKPSRTKSSPGDQFSSDSSPARLARKKHTPATLPRTKFSSSSTGTAQHRAMDKLKQHLTFTSEDEIQHREEQLSRQAQAPVVDLPVPVNNERNLHHQQSLSAPRNDERNGGSPLQFAKATNPSNPPADQSRVVDKLKQVRGYLRQATSLYIALSSKSTSPDEATDEDLEQLDKLAKLIRDLKAQEKAYVDFVQRSIATHGESSINNTPSTSVISLDGDDQNDAVSDQSEDLEGLRQQHALLRQMVEQQKQLKELQERQNALLDLQRHAENQLKEAEAEGRRITSLMNGHTVENESASGRSRSNTERSDDSRSSQPAAVGSASNMRGATGLLHASREQAQPNRKSSNEQKPENFKNRRLPERAAWVAESTGSLTPDNEAQALATADAAQERLELESKLMDLQAKKEQMDALVQQLHQLREMQLGKEIALPQERSVNETTENGDDDVPLATKSAKDTGDNVDDEKILEALQLHRKLRKLQDVRDKLERLKELFDEQQEQSEAESETVTRVNRAQRVQQPRESRGAESQPSGSNPDVGAELDDMLPAGNIDWMLNSGIDDPELLDKLRQVKAAKERVANLKQRNEQNNVVQPHGRAEGAASLAQAVAAEDGGDSAAQTDNETTASVSSSLMWQEDPEFQEKLRKLNAARKKLKKLQELVKKTEELPVGPNGRPYLPAGIVEMNFSTDEDEGEGEDEEDESTAAEGVDGDGTNDGRDSEEDATSETLVQEEASHAHRGQQDDGYGDSEQEYMDKLTRQRAALSQLLAEKQKLLETQEHLKRLRQNDAMTQTRQPDRNKPLDTFIHNATEASTSRQGVTADSGTQTMVSSEPRSDKYHEPGTSASNTLLWRELRRQRELQEQKLKKRKERLLLERKGRRSGLENASEDEGFGRSTLSADITTATWGGSTQMSSTQNDSAVSEGSSHDSDEEILVEVEDDGSDGIVQAEEEEEANSEVDIYPTTSTANRKQAPKSGVKQNASQKRLLFEGLRKQDLERHERFKGWQNSLFPSGNKRGAKKPQRFSNHEELTEEEMYNARERSMWERQCDVLQGQLENTTSLCNTLLRDQQTLISVLLNRGETPQPSTFGPNSFNQYQQRQQDALQGIQNYFEQQRFLVQQQQMLQNLTECYSQMQQQHEDMLHLQQSFEQLFTHPNPESEGLTPNARPSATPNAPPSTLADSRASNSFSFQPSTSLNYRPQDSVRETPPPSPFTTSQAQPSVERHVATAYSSASQQRRYPSVSFPWLPGLRNRQFQFVGSTNPDTGVPSPEASASQVHNQVRGPVTPVSARVVSATNTRAGNPTSAYNPTTYSDSQAIGSGSGNVVVGKQFPTPLRATAAAQLAEQDKSNWRGVKRRRQEDKMETDSISSHQSSLPGDSEKPGTESDAQSDYSLFEALRDSIYAEVATLISQNESRPHFLIELFRELQLLGSDYLRQRALYSLRDLVTRFLKDDPPGGTIESAMGAYSWLASASEQTPSESAGFSETDQDQDKTKVPEISTQGIYDYVEAVDSGSSLSTPNSGNHEPFASEFLGETVIHLDKALKSMRERGESECSSATGNEGATAVGQGETSSAGDVASESSLPDIQYPKIDTQALDRQIKKIMAKVIPCLDDHMEDTCSVELLEYIRKMVMGMLQEKNEAKEFSRFFHKQLESILQDSLAKFIGKRMKDCGEDLLVDISEILFNELAFYKLMQELDGGAKAKFFNREQKYRMENAAARKNSSQEEKTVETSRNTTEVTDDNEVLVENENAEDQEDEGSSSSSSEWQVVDETSEDKPQDMISREQLERDEETLGRDRDDAMAVEFDEPTQAEAADTESSQCIKVVELSMSESRPLASDDEEESEVDIAGDGNENEENAEGAVWNASVANGNQGAHNNMLSSQMAADNGAEAVAEDEEGATGGNENKQEEDQDDDLPTKFTGLTEADLQVKIAEEQSRNDGIHGIVVSMDNGDELAGDPNAIPEPEGSALVNGNLDEPEN
ncbi:pericentriolar material 1 protein-like [Dendronephthya gigantea]|uniref:pericentriolar material 1 protein-like n=1 Tax=Dendronephthya gigantea TaxID=151771 RepID=UPI001069EEA6|nr:pericentriolar material 1 protein-like [Dendronephthya gigantea]